ncbi:hypothetical protein OG389_00800 [Streptomyces sp. NBC_00435]|uniref:hypothetical protein n=1 Tax=Streptomyces sp. NBC_00435 TaxID=2903649 RepID=UPI002E1C2590
MDPAAIAESGHETCDRIGFFVRTDRKAAISAIQAGEISGARDAITHLCPEYKSLLT